MRIKDKVMFIFGVIDILIGIIGLIIIITLRISRGRILLLGVCFVCGITDIINGVETNAQRRKREEELYKQANMLGLLMNQEEKDD